MRAVPTNTTSRLRALICAALAVSLCAPPILTNARPESPEQSAQLLAAASPVQQALLNRGGSRLEHPSLRAGVDSALFLATHSHSPAVDRQPFPDVPRSRMPLHVLADTFLGRAPPVAIS